MKIDRTTNDTEELSLTMGQPESDMPTSSRPGTCTVITPDQGLFDLGFSQIWQRRELLSVLASRDLKVRYAQTIFGRLWIVLVPLIQIAVYSVLFGGWLKISSNGVPYVVFVTLGLVPWQCFARAVADGSSSIITNQALLEKVYVPRLLLPLSAIIGSFADLGIGLLILSVILAVYGVFPDANVIFAPLFLIMMLLTAFGITLWTSALFVVLRDVRHIMPFIIQFLFFATPVIYPLSTVPERWRGFLGLNPMVSVIEGLRWAVLPDAPPPPLFVLVISTAVALILLFTGAVFFRRVELSLVDRI